MQADVIPRMVGVSAVSIDGVYGYFALMHPSTVKDLKDEEARWKYKQRHHILRWERRYQRPYPVAFVQAGRLEGVTFHG